MAKKLIEGSAAEEATESPAFERAEDGAKKGKTTKLSSAPVLNTGKKNHMSGPNHAGSQVPVSSNPAGATAGGAKNSGGGYGSGGPQTGSGHMISGQQHAGPQVPGQSAAGGLGTGGGGFGGGGIKGGTTKMFGQQSASPQKPA